MKAFHFRLEAVLALREQAEREAQQRCAEAQRRVQQAVAEVEAAQAAITTAEQQRRAQLRGGCQASHLEQMRVYELLLRERHSGRVRDLGAAREQAEQAQMRLVAATQDREALEHLRDRQRRAYEYEAARAEQKALDEMSGRSRLLAGAWSTEAGA